MLYIEWLYYFCTKGLQDSTKRSYEVGFISSQGLSPVGAFNLRPHLLSCSVCWNRCPSKTRAPLSWRSQSIPAPRACGKPWISWWSQNLLPNPFHLPFKQKGPPWSSRGHAVLLIILCAYVSQHLFHFHLSGHGEECAVFIFTNIFPF